MDNRVRTILEHLVEKENETWATEGNGVRKVHFDASTLSDEDLIGMALSAVTPTISAASPYTIDYLDCQEVVSVFTSKDGRTITSS